ncbi:MAG: PAS domain S-box protein [Burkholderiales bacterium]
MGSEVRILLLEDVASDAELVERELVRAGIACDLRRVESEHEFVRALAGFAPDVILSDFSLPQYDGMAALRLVRSSRPEVPFIFVSGTIGEEAAVEALKQGASDYVLKGNLKRLPSAVRRVLQEAEDRIARHRSEQGRIKAEQLYHAVVELSPDAILVLREGQIVLINRSGLTLYGAERHSQMIGRRLFDLVHSDSRDAFSAWMQRLQHPGETQSRLKQKHTRLDGSVVHLELVSGQIEYAGERVTLVIARDVSVREQ